MCHRDFDIFTFSEGQLDCVELGGDQEEHVVHLQHQKCLNQNHQVGDQNDDGGDDADHDCDVREVLHSYDVLYISMGMLVWMMKLIRLVLMMMMMMIVVMTLIMIVIGVDDEITFS